VFKLTHGFTDDVMEQYCNIGSTAWYVLRIALKSSG